MASHLGDGVAAVLDLRAVRALSDGARAHHNSKVAGCDVTSGAGRVCKLVKWEWLTLSGTEREWLLGVGLAGKLHELLGAVGPVLAQQVGLVVRVDVAGLVGGRLGPLLHGRGVGTETFALRWGPNLRSGVPMGLVSLANLLHVRHCVTS